jgi:ubiquinone/menaquinone biosynthesis C-methylase UbiE
MANTVDHHSTYKNDADRYEALVSREDYQNNILPAITKIVPLEGLDVVELGAGTGRLTLMLSPRVKSIHAFDISPNMLAITRERLQRAGLTNWKLGAADHRNLPVTSHSADLVISGWSVCYLVDWYRETWRTELDRAMNEIERVLRPGGTLILIETMGTGFETPHPPEHLLGYYAYLKEHGFSSTWIRTDYRFESVEQSEELALFFFGDALAQEVRDNHWDVLPECTGYWWKKF